MLTLLVLVLAPLSQALSGQFLQLTDVVRAFF